MNRLDQRHRAARVDLNRSVRDDGTVDQPPIRRLLSPTASFYAAVFGFVCCSLAVIVSANLLALSI